MNIYPPIIVIGMHRSGTSLVAEILQNLGLFIGWKQDINNEAQFFRKINRWLFFQNGCRWDNPDGIKYFFDDTQLRGYAKEYVEYLLSTPQIVSFLGWNNFLSKTSLFQLRFPWGWKDPANTYTLPFWLDIFPDAKVINVYRHGIDVAYSLVVREREYQKKWLVEYSRKKWRYMFKFRRGGFTDSVRCSSLSGAFSLWEEYLETAQLHLQNLDVVSLNLKYEDILLEPHQEIRKLINFCGLGVTQQQVNQIIQKLDQNRAFAYRKNADLVSLENKVKDRLLKWGY